VRVFAGLGVVKVEFDLDCVLLWFCFGCFFYCAEEVEGVEG
jgi:hypothetical protein